MPVKFYVPVNTGNLNVSDTTTVKDLDITGTVTGLNLSDISGLQTALDLKADKTYVDQEISNLIGSAPGVLDTLGEIATALDNDANLASTLMTAIGQKADSSALSSLAGIVDTKVNSNDVSLLISGKADQSQVDLLSTTVSGKADQSQVDSLSTTVSGKADQSQVDSLSTTISGKADQSQVDSLSTTVSGKADKTYVDDEIIKLIGSAPGVLDTLGEIATALGDDANLASTLMTAINSKANTSDLDNALNAINTINTSIDNINGDISNLQTQIDNNINNVTSLNVQTELSIDGKDGIDYRFVVEGDSVSDKLVLKKGDFSIMEMSKDSASTGSSTDTVTFNAPVVINDSLTFGSGATIVGTLTFHDDQGIIQTLDGNKLKRLLALLTPS